MPKFFVITGTQECINADELLKFDVSTVEIRDGSMKHCIEYVLKHDLSYRGIGGNSAATVSQVRYAIFETEELARLEWVRLVQFVGASIF
jgi:hypothetical protein